MSTISRLSSRRHSAACRAFRNLYPELKTGIRHELPSVNAKLYGDGLICKETKDKANEDATLDEVEDCLKSDESVFEAFISVLSETSCGVTLVKKLRSFFEHHLGNREAPLAEDVAAPSLLQYTPSEQVSTILGVCVSVGGCLLHYFLILFFQASCPPKSTYVGTNVVPYHKKDSSDAGYVTGQHWPKTFESADRSEVDKEKEPSQPSSIETGITNQSHSHIYNTSSRPQNQKGSSFDHGKRHSLAMQQQEKTDYPRTSHSEPASSDDTTRFAIDALLSCTKSLSASFDENKKLQQNLADQQTHRCQIETEKYREIMKLTDENERLKDHVAWLETDRNNQAAQIREVVQDNIHLKAMNDKLVQENAALKQQLNMS